jgi:hypothetical protein
MKSLHAALMPATAGQSIIEARHAFASASKRSAISRRSAPGARSPSARGTTTSGHGGRPVNRLNTLHATAHRSTNADTPARHWGLSAVDVDGTSCAVEWRGGCC